MNTLVGFADMEFPQDRHIVYVLYFRQETTAQDIPFYVGQSSRHMGRFGDYVSAKFSAPTDFKVGEAIRYLCSLGISVGIRYKCSQNRREDERRICEHFRQNHRLLNDLRGFNYNQSNEDCERARVHSFMETIVDEARGACRKP